MTNLTDHLRRVPFFRFILPFIAGILAGYFTQPFPLFVGLTSLFILFALLVLFRQSGYRTTPVFGTILYFFLFIFGWYWYQQRQYRPQPVPEQTTHFAIVSSFPEEKTNSYKTILQILPDKQNILTYLEKDSIAACLTPGQVIALHRPPTAIQPPTNPGEFNYREYMIRHSIAYRFYLRTEDYFVTSAKVRLNLRQQALVIRKQLQNVFVRYSFSGDEMSILSALVLGNRENIDPEIKEEFANSGAIHILAVSGLHVGIIYFVFSFLLKFLKTNRKGRFARLLILLTVIWVYAFITGLSPSVLRAATMFSFIAIGENINRQNNIYNTLAASAFLLLLINPMLLFEVGFQLSYAAVLSIVFFQPLIYHTIYASNWWLDKLWGLLTVSLAAQIGVSPLSLYYFHQFPVYFWLTNLFAIPLTTLIIYTAFLLLSFSFIPLLGKAIALLLHILVKALLYAVWTVNTLPGSIIPNISFTTPMLVTSFLVIIFLTLFIIGKQKIYLQLILLSLIILSGITTFNKYQLITQREIVFFNIPRKTLIAAVHRKDIVWISSDDSVTTRKKMAIYMEPFEQKHGTNTSVIIPLSGKRARQFSFLYKKNNMINFAGMRIWVQEKAEIPEFMPPINLTYLHKFYPEGITKFKAEEHPAMQFVTNSPPFPDKRSKKAEKSKMLPENVYSLPDKGALRANIFISDKNKKSDIKIGYITH